MKRSEFLKRLGLGLIAVPVLPVVVREMTVEELVDDNRYNVFLTDEAGTWPDGVAQRYICGVDPVTGEDPRVDIRPQYMPVDNALVRRYGEENLSMFELMRKLKS